MAWVGVDVGGTFTDVAVYDQASGALTLAKAPTTPADPAAGVLAGLGRAGVALPAARRIVHGTTIGTNAILERTGTPPWMLTTRGFRDTLDIGRTNRTILYDIRAAKPASPVPRHQIIEIGERRLADGGVRQPLDEAEVRAALAGIRTAAGGRPGALVIGFLHSWADPAHERAAARLAAELLPGWFVCTSAEVLPEVREYERFSTAALNAYIGPVVGGYLTRLGAALAAGGYPERLYVTTSSGGIVTAESAARLPVHTVLSGPAGGVAAAVALGRRIGCPDLVTYDMGGTSTDVCLIGDLEPALTTEQHIAGLPNRTPQIEINSIGAGGGSIAWLDAGDALRVGPRSAGAEPGPACYGRGGREPTITDANLLLGRIPADVPLAGQVGLDPARAREAVGRLAGRVTGLGDPVRVAEGIVRVAVARMVSAIKEISIARGHDPRDFALLAYGGAGPMHAALIAEELEMPRVVVPPGPGNFSALGALLSDLRRDYVRTRLTPTRRGALADVEQVFAGLEAEARRDLAAEGIAVGRIALTRALGMRYVGQSWELLVRWPAGAGSLAALEAAFHEAHRRRYGHAAGGPAEIVNFRLTAVGEIPGPEPAPWTVGGPVAGARRGQQPVVFGGEGRTAAVYRRGRLPAGGRLAGPALIEEMGATTVVPPGWTAAVGPWGELTLTREGL